MTKLSRLKARATESGQASRPDPIAIAKMLGNGSCEGAALRDRERRLPSEEVAAVKRNGLHGLRVPKASGGAGESWLTTAKVVIELARGDPNVAQAIQSGIVLVESLRADAPEPLRQHIFDHINSGELVTNAVAERGGDFYGDIATRITGNGPSRRITGVKYYATGSAFAERFFVTALDHAGRVVTAILPRDRPGIAIEDDWNGFGQRTTASGTVRLDDVAVNAEEIFFAIPPQVRRWHLQAGAQIIHAAIDAGIAQAALEDGVKLCQSRGKPLRESGVNKQTDDPYVIHAVGEMATKANAARILVEHAASLVDVAADKFFAGSQDFEADVAASIAVGQARIVTAESSLFVSQRLFDLANASGTDQSLGLDRHWRNARAHTTHDPLSYKFRFIGDHLLNGRTPPSTAKF